MTKFVVAWRDINNPERAFCVGRSVEEPAAVELVSAELEEAEDRPYRAVRFDSYDEAFSAAEALAGMLIGLEAAVVAEDELEAQFATDRPSPRPMLETGPHPLEEVLAEKDREIARLVSELESERNRAATDRREAKEIVAELVAQMEAEISRPTDDDAQSAESASEEAP